MNKLHNHRHAAVNNMVSLIVEEFILLAYSLTVIIARTTTHDLQVGVKDCKSPTMSCSSLACVLFPPALYRSSRRYSAAGLDGPEDTAEAYAKGYGGGARVHGPQQLELE